MSKTALRRRAVEIADELEKLYPDVRCELDFETPFQLLVATILSAQCTDKRVNMVTPVLFKRFPDAAAMAAARPSELEAIIKSTGFYRNKAKSILGASRLLVEELDGVVPQSMEALLRLPGVARKTANVILGTAFTRNDGIAVDTHVMRLCDRLGLSKHAGDPVAIEKDLCALLPSERWTRVGHQIIWHGRRVCDARAPRCAECTLLPLCPTGPKLLRAKKARDKAIAAAKKPKKKARA
jgi:endonuclease-3